MDEGKLTSQKSQSQRRNTVIIVKKKKKVILKPMGQIYCKLFNNSQHSIVKNRTN